MSAFPSYFLFLTSMDGLGIKIAFFWHFTNSLGLQMVRNYFSSITELTTFFTFIRKSWVFMLKSSIWPCLSFGEFQMPQNFHCINSTSCETLCTNKLVLPLGKLILKELAKADTFRIFWFVDLNFSWLRVWYYCIHHSGISIQGQFVLIFGWMLHAPFECSVHRRHC